MGSTAKQAFRDYVEGCRIGGDLAASARTFFSPAASINVVHPFNALEGFEAYLDRFIIPLNRSFNHLFRNDYIAFTGEFEGAEWATCTGHYTGHFERDWIGIPASGAMAHLRFGEFHRIEDGRAAESYIFLDIPALLIDRNVWPIADSPGRARGFTGFLPGPATGDGLQWHDNDPARSRSSVDMVTTMLRALATPDEAWRPFWHEKMTWYGPAAFGAFAGVENFAGFQVPFEEAFEGWSGGASNNGMTEHACRFADGDYICSAGWPSLTGVQVKPFLDQPATNKRVFMRVCDWWRREDNLLVENWIFVDIPHVLLQLGRDVLGEIPRLSAGGHSAVKTS